MKAVQQEVCQEVGWEDEEGEYTGAPAERECRNFLYRSRMGHQRQVGTGLMAV